MSGRVDRLAARYAAWVDRRRGWVLAAGLAVAIAGGALAAQLPLRPDLSNLLPPSAKSVRDLEVLKRRARAFGSVFVVVEAADPAVRERATRWLQQHIEALADLGVEAVVYDDGPVRRYFWQHRFLFAPLEDLVEARDALRDAIRRAKLAANPLYISLEDEDDAAADRDLDDRVADLRRRLDEAEAKANAPAGFVSDDGALQLLIVRTAFASSDLGPGARLVARLSALVDQVRAEMPGVDAGVTGNIVKNLDEQRAIVRGMTQAAVITAVLCAIALVLYYRSVLPVATSLWALAIGTLATFGFARLAIGHLNLVTAFLAAIVVGNGINPGLILLARYFEELRAGARGVAALGRSIAGAAHGTLAASLAAAVAYGSLVITDFRGFRHFGVIGFVGMVACWLATFAVLPAGLAVLWRAGRVRASRAPAVGDVLARVLPRDLDRVARIGVAVAVVAAAATAHYVLSDPLQEDWSNLRPRGTETAESLAWSRKIDERFTTKFQRGLTQRFVVGLERREDVPVAVAVMRAADEGVPDDQKLLHDVRSLDDLLPDRQQDKLAVLADIRALLTDDAVAALDPDDRELVDRLRPPADLRPLGDEDVPEELAWPFIERDGTRGRLILATASLRFKTWNVRHRMEFARRFRQLPLPAGAVVGGQSFIFADMVAAMYRDGPRATVVALLGAILVVGVVVGFGRYGAVTVACAAIGVLGMIALVSAVGLEVNVIDFIALPLTIGLGVDYSVNIVARFRQQTGNDPRRALATTGGAVLLCSFTTIVGYGSLLVSASGGIRSFGLAAILGEFACVAAALALAPALLLRTRPRDGGG